MQSKGVRIFLWIITGLLILSTIHQLSYTYFASNFEDEKKEEAISEVEAIKDSVSAAGSDLYLLVRDTISNSRIDTFNINSAIDMANLEQELTDALIQGSRNEEIHPIFGDTYAEVKGKELALGLDLEGGMSVTLEVAVDQWVELLAGKSKVKRFRVPFEEARTEYAANGGDFIEIFVDKFEASQTNPEGKLAALFSAQKEELTGKTNAEIEKYMRDELQVAMKGIRQTLERRISQGGLSSPTIDIDPITNRIIVELPGVKDRKTVRQKISKVANLQFFELENSAVVYQSLIGVEQQLAAELGYSKETTEEKEAEETIAEEVETEVQEEKTEDSLGLELEPEEALASNEAGLEDEEGLEMEETDTTSIQEKSIQERFRDNPIQSVIGYLGQGSIYYSVRLQDTALVNSVINHEIVLNALPQLGETEVKLMWSAKPEETESGDEIMFLYPVRVPVDGTAPVSGDDLESARSEFNTGSLSGGFMVSIRFNNEGAEKWGDLTEKNLKLPIAITMDNIVYSAPTVQEAMYGGSAQITGNFTKEETDDLAGLLAAGSLPVPVSLVDESYIGPSLGAENISKGMASFGVALLIVLIYMVFYYSKSGLVADVALVTNIILIFGALSGFGAVLTLPGIAGIVLTIGMSVDANVLIFERIREELSKGYSIQSAINDGYKKAMSAIIDANVTTFLTALILFTFGIGPIKGFASTLIIGIFTSLFAAIFITRLIFIMMLERKKEISFSSKITKNWFKNVNIQFVAKRKVFYGVSLVIILAGIGSLFTNGLNLGVEFEGGRKIQYMFDGETAPDRLAIEADLKKGLIEEDGSKAVVGVKTIGNDYNLLITTNYLSGNTDETSNTKAEETIKTILDNYGKNKLVESRNVEPTIAETLRETSTVIIITSLLVIFLYIRIRFRRWQYGLGAILAMIHDVLIVLSIYSFFKGFAFSEINQAFVAAVLTVVGYSINDTVVVFDRIREYLNIGKIKDEKETINKALNSTLSRTINTSVSTLIVLLIILFFGGDSIQGFVFALTVGVVVGTYSSLFIAAPSLIDFSKKKED